MCAGRTDRRIDRTIHGAVWSQLKRRKTINKCKQTNKGQQRSLYYLIAGALGCVFIDTETQESYVHYSDIITGAMASQITSLTIVYSTVYSVADQIKHQSSAALAFVRGIHRWQLNSPHKWTALRKMFPFDDVIMTKCINLPNWYAFMHWSFVIPV